MLYYAQELSGAGSSALHDAQAFLSDPELTEHEGPNALDDTVPLETSLVATPDIFNMPADNVAQPKLSEILQAVYKCTVSVDDLKECFGGLKETVSLLRQDIQKIRERTMAVEGWVSDLEDQMPPLTRDAKMAAQQVIPANNRANDIENCLRRNNVGIVG